MSLSDCVPLRSLLGHDACTDSLARTLFSLVIIQDPVVQYSFLFCLRPRSHTGTSLTDDLKCDCRHVWHVCRHYTQSIKSQRRLLLRRYGEGRRQQLPRNRQLCRLLAHLFHSNRYYLFCRKPCPISFHFCETRLNLRVFPTGMRGDQSCYYHTNDSRPIPASQVAPSRSFFSLDRASFR